MFCRYCGKEIPDGSVCDCQQSQINMGAVQTGEFDPNVQASAQPKIPTEFELNINFDVENVKSGFKDLFLRTFVYPLSVFRYAELQTNKIPQFIVGAVSVVLSFIFTMIEFSIVLGEYSDGAPVGRLALAASGIVLVSILSNTCIPFLFSLNSQKFTNTLGMACTTKIIPTVTRLLFTFSILIESGELAVLTGFLNLLICLALDFEMIKTAYKGNRDRTIYLFLLTELITFILSYLIGKSVLGNILNSFYRLF